MKRSILFSFFISLSFLLHAQYLKTYEDTLISYQANYKANHDVIKGSDTNYFRFFPIDKNYCITASFKKIDDKEGFIMQTKGTILVRYYKYGSISFKIHDTTVQLYIYQSSRLMNMNDFKNYLFLPFTDKTTGEQTYEDGRYIDLTIDDIKNNSVVIDFNKCYNPDCAYTSGYSCPLPPKENELPVTIMAGEMKFAKP